MAQPVWVLSVDLQTKTATFQSGMADAAKSARNAFKDIGSGAAGMGGEVAHSSMDVRHSIGLVDNVIRGAHAQAMADLIRMYAQSALVMSTLPLAATAAGLALIGGIAYEVYEKIHALHGEQEKLSNDMITFGTSVNQAFRSLDDKMLTAEQRADELRGDHLGALQKQLELIDHQSLSELVHSFGLVSKAADAVFADLKSHWYTEGIGSDGAKHALQQFQVQYESLLSQGKSGEATDLLAGTLASARQVLAAQMEAKANMGAMLPEAHSGANFGQWLAANQALKKAGVGFTDSEIKAQQQLVAALSAQVGVEQRINDLKKTEDANATKQTGNEMAAQHAAAARASIESQLRMGASAIEADKVTADARLTIQRASIEQRLASDLSFASRTYQMQLAGNQEEMAALDKGGKDYQNQLKALQDKALEITAQHQTAVAQLRAKAATESAQRDLTALQGNEREKIGATRQGSEARLTAIDAAIKEEQAKNLQDTAFYRQLLNERVELTRQSAEDEAKDKAAAATESAQHDFRMGELRIAAERAAGQSSIAQALMTGKEKVQLEMKLANAEYQLQQTELNRKLAALDEHGKDYESKKQALNDRLMELEMEHQNQMAQIQQQSAGQQYSNQTSAMVRLEAEYAQGFTQVLMRHERFSKMMNDIGDRVVSGMMQNAIMSAMTADFAKEKEAASAARHMFLAGTKFPFPANIVMAPALGAMAFASMMAFEKGGVVPGVGHGDTVPAMLTPGEGVVPKGVMDGLSTMARSGQMGGGGNHYTVHVHNSVNASALDGDGMQTVLEKHADQLQKHFENTLRRMNH